MPEIDDFQSGELWLTAFMVQTGLQSRLLTEQNQIETQRVLADRGEDRPPTVDEALIHSLYSLPSIVD